MTERYDKFKRTWEAYNGFALVAIVLGILCFLFAWFQRSHYISGEFSHYEYKYLIELFYWDIKTTLFGLLYCLGLVFLIFYYLGVVLSNRGNFETPMEKYSRIFFLLSLILLITFEILMYFHFVRPPYAESGWFQFFWNVVWKGGWHIHIGFILGIIMVGMVIISYLYDRFMLQRHYKKHLPDYFSRKTKESIEL